MQNLFKTIADERNNDDIKYLKAMTISLMNWLYLTSN